MRNRKSVSFKSVAHPVAATLSLLMLIFVFVSNQAIGKGDKYGSLDELRQNTTADVDYRVTRVDRDSWATIVSPHGGNLERGTSEIARKIAGDEYNLFDFQILRTENVQEMHVTSTNFKDSNLNRLLERSSVCVSIHGRKGDDQVAWLGGTNECLKTLIAKYLEENQIQCTLTPPRLEGTSSENFVNAPKDHGVQLELPRALRESGEHAHTPKKLVESVRKALVAYAKLNKVSDF